jgi:hypothetical protein
MKNVWGLVPMPIFSKSPYDGIRCAELDEDCFEEWKDVLGPDPVDVRDNPGIMNPRLKDLGFGHLHRARFEIEKSGIVFSVHWSEGRIRGKDFGSIPKRELLLCLYEHRFSKGDEHVLKSVISSLDCFELVIEVRAWNANANNTDNVCTNY